VSRQAVQQWISGATQPSRMALMLAEQLYRAGLELAPGLPLGRRASPNRVSCPWKGARQRLDTSFSLTHTLSRIFFPLFPM
jgi:hypothetical protein